MEERERQKVYDIMRELSTVARDLDAVSYEIANEFNGIGEAICANSIRNLSDKYRDVRNELSKIE